MNTHPERGPKFRRRPGKPTDIPYELVWKVVHGQRVQVKVYPARWAHGATHQTCGRKGNQGKI